MFAYVGALFIFGALEILDVVIFPLESLIFFTIIFNLEFGVIYVVYQVLKIIMLQTLSKLLKLRAVLQQDFRRGLSRT